MFFLQGSVQKHFPGDGIHEDAYLQLRGILLLELRLPLPAPAAPGQGRPRHLLREFAINEQQLPAGLHGEGDEGGFGSQVNYYFYFKSCV